MTQALTPLPLLLFIFLLRRQIEWREKEAKNWEMLKPKANIMLFSLNNLIIIA